MAAWRCFVGLPLPEAYQDGLARARELGKGLRSRLSWTRPGNWHLTLKFLGDVDQTRLPEVVGALSGVSWEAFEMRAGGAGAFPPRNPRPGVRHRPPRVLWVGLEQGAGQCARLARAVDAALAPLGFEREKRAFAAHLTLARVKHPRGDDWDGWLSRAAGLPWPAFTAGEMVLWRSELSAGGPGYTRLETFAAPGPSGP